MRDSDAALIIVDARGVSASIGTQRANEWARKHGKPEVVASIDDKLAAAHAATWLKAQQARFGSEMTLSIGGPRAARPQASTRQQRSSSSIFFRSPHEPRSPQHADANAASADLNR